MYVKIFDRILDSSIWDQPDHVRIAWITILVLADADGIVRGTVTALARRANITSDQMAEALAVLTAPDPQSTTPDDEGRRVQEIGQNLWYVTTHNRYRSMQDADVIREQTKERVRNYREKRVTHGNAQKRTVTHGNGHVTDGNAQKRTVTAPDPLLAIPDDDERKVQSDGQNSRHVTGLGQDMRVQDAGSFETQSNESARNYNESQNVTHGNARVTHGNARKRHTDTDTDTDLDHNPPTPLAGESPSNGEGQVEGKKKKAKVEKKPSPRHTEIETLFKFWQERLNHPRAKLPKPASLTYRRMDEAIEEYGPDGVQAIVRGAVEDIKRWPDRARHDTLDILLREGNITRLMGFDPEDPANAGRLSTGKPGSWAIPTVKTPPPEPKPLPPLTAPTLDWSAVIGILAARFPVDTREWIAPLVYVGDRGDGIELRAADEFTAQWVEGNHREMIHDVLFDMTGRHVPLHIVSDEGDV